MILDLLWLPFDFARWLWERPWRCILWHRRKYWELHDSLWTHRCCICGRRITL